MLHKCEKVHFEIVVSREMLCTIMLCTIMLCTIMAGFGRTCCFCQGVLHPKYGSMR